MWEGGFVAHYVGHGGSGAVREEDEMSGAAVGGAYVDAVAAGRVQLVTILGRHQGKRGASKHP
jgi:hypothetical protein